MSDQIGTAFVPSEDGEQPQPRIRTDGDCVQETLNALERGDHGKPLPRQVLEGIRTQTAEILGSIVDAYETYVAVGEVGLGGRARAADAPPSNKSPTGLLYGRVQSGKTAAMVVTSAMAIDNGFRAIVILTSNNIKLVEQTAERFADLDQALIYSSLEGAAGAYSWDADRANIQRWIGTRGVVFVCAKEDGHLTALIQFLQKIGAAQYPALIMDDEADHATPDTQNARRSRGRPVPYASTTFRLVVENDDPAQPGFSLRETLVHNVFLQVTATPYGLLLQSLVNPLRPAFTTLLRPGHGYTGGEAFFANAAETASPPLVYVDEDEAKDLQGECPQAPIGLARSIAFFLLSATAHKLVTNDPPRFGYKYLCHTSVAQSLHQKLADLIRQYVDGLASDLEADITAAMARPEIVWAQEELRKTTPSLPSPEQLGADVLRYLPNRSILVVNAQAGAALKFNKRYNFIVGGNILGRGLTIDDLLVTYYLRQARVSQMDTMHQHARMYGYRGKQMPFTRVFLNQTLALRFRQIHEAEQGLREMLTEGSSTLSIPVEVAGNLKPTRSNILDIGAISAYRPGQQVYPVEPVHDPATLGHSFQEISKRLEDAFGGTLKPNIFLPIDLALAKELIDKVKIQQDDGDWSTQALQQVLDASASRYGSRAYLYFREFKPRRKVLSSGALSGEEHSAARAQNAPVLCLLRGRKGEPWDAPIWYPTVVFPSDMPAMVFNRDA